MNHAPGESIRHKGPHWQGFTLQLFVFTILPLTILLLVITFGSLTLHHNSMRALVGDRDLRAVRSAANSLTQEIEHHTLTLQLFANQVSASPNTAALLESSSLPGFESGLALVSPDGVVLAGSVKGLPDLAERLPAPAPNVVFSDPVRAGEDWLVLVITPLSGGDRLVGALSPATLARTALVGIATPQTTILLLSSSGDVLYQFGEYDHSRPKAEHYGVEEVLRGESGVNYSTTPMLHIGGDMPTDGNNAEHLVAFTPVPPLGWGLVLEETWEEIASPLLRLTQSAPLVLVPVLLLALVALWFGIRQIVQPLQALEGRAARMASGDFSAVRSRVGGISEIHHLQDTLVEMAQALQAAQASLHGYIGALTAGIENERRSLARELHDDTLQALIALNQHVQMALLKSSDPQQRQSLLELQNRVGQTITNLRRAIGGLRPIYLEDLGLSAALGMLVKEANSRLSPEGPGDEQKITLEIDGAERRLPAETELALYRIAQEALNNAVQHAQAQHIRVILQFPSAVNRSIGESAVQLTIVDDGGGFSVPTEPHAFARKGHYGLLSMHERADLAGAGFEISAFPGKGTRITVKYIL